MKQDTMTFDIETIPQTEELTKIQQEELQKRLSKETKTESELEDYRRLLMATSPYYGQIVCIGLMKTEGSPLISDTLAIHEGTEKEILERFWHVIRNHDGLFISFNGLNFDVPFIIKRSLYHGVLPTNKNFLNLKRFSTFPHFDVKLVLGDWDKYATGTLKLVADFLKFPSPKDGEIKAENVAEAFNEGKIKEIAEYCLKDVITTFKIYEKLKKYV